MVSQSAPAPAKRDVAQERKFHRALEGSDQLLKVLGKHGRRFSVPAEEMESFGHQVAKVCWEEARVLLHQNGALQAAQDESTRLRRQLSQANLSAMKQLGLRAAKDAADPEDAKDAADPALVASVDDSVTFYDPLGYVDSETRDLVLTIVCDKVEQIKRGTAPNSLVTALLEHIGSGRLEEQRKAARNARNAGLPSDVQSLQELLADAESLAREAEDDARASEEKASRAVEQAQEAKLQLKELKSELGDAKAQAEALEAEVLREQTESKAREGELVACCDSLREELEALQAALEEERRAGSELREEASRLREEVSELRSQGARAAMAGTVGDTGGPEDLLERSSAEGGGSRGRAGQGEEGLEEPPQPSGDTGGSGSHPGGMAAAGGILGGVGTSAGGGGGAGDEQGMQTEALAHERAARAPSVASEERSVQTQVTGGQMEDREMEVKKMRLLLEELQMKIKELAEQCRKHGIGDQVAEILEGVGLKEVLKKKTCFERLYEDAQKRAERLELLREKVRRERRALLNASAVEEDIDIKPEPSVLSTVEQSRLPALRRMLRIDEAIWPGGSPSPVLSKATPKEGTATGSTATPVSPVRSCGVLSPPPDCTSVEASPSAALPPLAPSPPPPRPAMGSRLRQQPGEPWPPARRGSVSPPVPARFRVPGRRQLLRENSLPAIPRRPVEMAELLA